jgi:magnesium transporter
MKTMYYATARSPKLMVLDSFRAKSWVQVIAPDEAELTQLSKDYDLELDLLHDGIDPYEASRIEKEGDTIYVYVRYCYPEKQGNSTEPLLIVYHPDVLITIQRRATPILDRLINGVEHAITTQKTKTALQILEEVNSSYRRHLIKVNRQILGIRSQLKRTELSKAVLINFVELEDDLNEFMGALQPQAAVLRSLLSARYLRLLEEDRDLVEDLSLGTNELIELVNSRQKTIVNIRQAYEAIATSDLNRTFRRLTSISIFLMIPTVVSGLFGMNVLLPFAHHGYAFWYVIGFVCVSSLLVIYLFHRRRWL